MRLLIAGGGTGGHVFPGIAIAEEVTTRAGGEVLFVGTARGLEATRVPAAGFPLELLDVSGLNRVGAAALARGVARLPRAFWQTTGLLRRFRPDVVIGVGGYVSGPVVLAAALLGYPTAILEQNSYPGFTNRVLGRVVRRVYIAFEHARRFFPPTKLLLVGNPLRRQFVAGIEGPADGGQGAPPVADDARPAAWDLLVLGGSQGARAINDLVVGAVSRWRSQGAIPSIPSILHQAGAKDDARVRALYAALEPTVPQIEVRPFIEDVPAALRAARLVIARAGALTLAELAIIGRPAILIPLPTAADDHQAFNAAELAEAGAAVVLPQPGLTAERLATLSRELLDDPPRRSRMAAAMRALGRPDAASAIVDDLARLVNRAPASTSQSTSAATSADERERAR
jgi:UDP-N-acetylglucosamine--N-acetylmuramyl-(pentapeptide) pyrophosphoryl-undecaprenol N-acetylglucosamine transferase